MGNSNSNNERNQVLLQPNNQIHDVDISLVINDQPQVKQIYAIKNPVFLKRNTLTLERDSDQRNFYYIEFVYDAMVELNINIYFNANRNITNETKLISNNNLSLNSSNYLPSRNFVDKILRFNNCPRGQNIKFFNVNAMIDINFFNEKKQNKVDSYDVVIEFEPIFEDFSINKNKVSNSDNQIYFYTLCKLTNDETNSTNLISSPYKIKTELQRLKSQSMWFDIHEVFNSALETGECLICCNNQRNTIFLPCNHSCSCQTCAHSLRMRNNPCPICKNSK